MSAPATARRLEAVLVATFGARFEIHARQHRGGTCLEITWARGPAPADVDAIAQLFTSSTTRTHANRSVRHAVRAISLHHTP